MRSLVLAQDFPWPPGSGSFLRLVNVIDALAALGEVELFSPVMALRDLPCEMPEDSPVSRWTTASYPKDDFSAASRWRWFTGNLPLEVTARDFQHPRAVLSTWVRPPYDFVWCSKATTYAALGRPRYGPTVVDLDDLEDRKIMARLESGSLQSAYPATARGVLHRSLAGGQARINASRWRRLQKDIAAETDAVVVCSDLDAERVDVANCRVVPNGYDAPEVPLGRLTPGSPPTVLFQGVLHYAPNSDAVHWLVRSIMPELRRRVSDVTLRLVGAPDTPIRQLDDPPQVTVVGRVPEMAPELRRADLVVVPVRYGSGTRVKALEAFAHRIPVVSTSLGIEGLGAVDGVHLLVADDAASFAEACARLLGDWDLRRRLTDAAFDLLMSRHQWSTARGAVMQLASDLQRSPVSPEPEVT